MPTRSTAFADSDYREAMGQLLVLYTQVDQLIMEICAERIAAAPDDDARLALAKQVGDESRHVQLQREWMQRFGVAAEPLITPRQQETIRAHFRSLGWLEFLADLYLCVEALGSEAVERIVPLADPGTRASLKVPLSDELDHVDFGVARLRQELAALPPRERSAFLAAIPERIEALTRAFHAFGLNVPELFSSVGADYDRLCSALELRQEELLETLAA